MPQLFHSYGHSGWIQVGVITSMYMYVMYACKVAECLDHVIYRLADLAAEFELGLRPSKQDLLDCLSNSEEVQQIVRIPVSFQN